MFLEDILIDCFSLNLKWLRSEANLLLVGTGTCSAISGEIFCPECEICFFTDNGKCHKMAAMTGILYMLWHIVMNHDRQLGRLDNNMSLQYLSRREQ